MEKFISQELTRETLNKKIEDIIIGESLIEIRIEDDGDDDDQILIKGEHQQDCCEQVYADFSVFKHYKNEIVGKDVKEIVFRGVGAMGIIICFYYDWEDSTKVFVPCYNEQNGYYSDELELIIDREVEPKRINVSQFVEDHIY